MAKNLKLNIKNTQIAQAIDLGGLKSKLAKKKAEGEEPSEKPAIPTKESSALQEKEEIRESSKESVEDHPRIRARSKSAFAEPRVPESKTKQSEEASREVEIPKHHAKEFIEDDSLPKRKTSEELRKEIFGEVALPQSPSLNLQSEGPANQPVHKEELPSPLPKSASLPPQAQPPEAPKLKKGEHAKKTTAQPKAVPPPAAPPASAASVGFDNKKPGLESKKQPEPRVYEKLGPTGRHVNDLLPNRGIKPDNLKTPPLPEKKSAEPVAEVKEKAKEKSKGQEPVKSKASEEEESKKGVKPLKAKEFRDIKPTRKVEGQRSFDARDRQGLRASEEDRGWRRRRPKHQQRQQEDVTIRPTSLKVLIPISIKDLAVEMKLKASQLISKLFMQGIVVTLNDYLEDETTIQLLGHEFGCEITLDTAEAERLQVTDKSIRQEISETSQQDLSTRPSVVAFMGHVDHGKTSLIDYIRKSNRASGEAGAITQHIGAFKCHTAVGDIAVLDTPGHEAFSAMRARGAEVTDIVVLVIAGDEGIRQQTIEAIQHAKLAKVSIVVAINKCDKPNFDQELVYRQLSEQDLLPEAWGGQVITVNCSATTGEGIQTLLEMLALQAEVLELKANPGTRARGSVLESEMHKGLGAVATVLVQNGTLRLGDALVFGQTWGRVKTMRNEFGTDLKEASPSTPVEITGLSGLPEAGEEFIAVKNEREARDIAEGRKQGIRQSNLQVKKKLSLENIFQQAADTAAKKILNLVLRTDMQGSLEAIKSALLKITSKKAEINIIFAAVGEVSESDVQLAAASKAVIIGFHTQIESHADDLVKQLGVQVRLHNIIYHAVDDVKVLLAGLLDKIPVETEKGKAVIKAIFKSSQYGIIAGCLVEEGSIYRNQQIRVRRDKEIIWKGSVSSLKRVKEDVREVAKGLECGIVLNGFSDYKEDDILESYEVTYIVQEL